MSITNYNRLIELQKQYPELTYDNKGYDELKSDVIDRHKEQLAEISSILKEEVTDFGRFQNFKPEGDSFSIRCQVVYSHELGFIGVEYIPIASFKE